MTDKMITLKGSVPVNKHKRIGPADPHERVEITIVLERKSEDGLPTLEEFLRGKRCNGLTRQQLAEKHGAKPEDAEAVRLWAGKQGLSVLHSDLGSRLLHLVGSVATLSRAFGVKMSMYHHSRTQTKFRCPESDIQIPKKLASAIAAVFGLNDMPVVVRRHRRGHSGVRPTRARKTSSRGRFSQTKLRSSTTSRQPEGKDSEWPFSSSVEASIRRFSRATSPIKLDCPRPPP